ncbi:MAG: hypothetical protein OXI16_01810 [Chloroflexota bacterium]|nr:hypothetical protein [Chloroflexota bacterium]
MTDGESIARLEAENAEIQTHFATKADLKALETRLLWAIFSVGGAILAAILVQTILG